MPDRDITSGATLVIQRFAQVAGELDASAGNLAHGHQVDDRPEGIRAMNGGAAAVDDFDTLEITRFERQVEVVVARLRVVNAHAVHEYEDLAECGSSHLQISLHAKGTAIARIDTWQAAEEVGDAGGSAALDLLAVEDEDIPTARR